MTKIVLPEMATLTIRLVEYKQTFVLPKEWLLKELPESLFASALGEDPNATTLDLTHPDVHPSVMRLLVGLAKGIEPLKHCPHLSTAHRYLNLPRLLVYGEVLYTDIPDRKNGNAKANNGFTMKLLRQDRHLLYSYLLARGYQPPGEDLFQAALHNSREIIRLLLALPKYDVTWNEQAALRTALEECHFEAAQLILAHPKVDPSFGDNCALYSAIQHHQTDLCRFLLVHPKLQLDHSNYLSHVIETGNVELLRLFLQDERFVIPPTNNYLVEAVILGMTELLPILSADNRCQGHIRRALCRAARTGYTEALRFFLGRNLPMDDVYMALGWASIDGQIETFRLLLEDARMDVGTALDYCDMKNPTFREVILADPRMAPLRHDLVRAARTGYIELTKLILGEHKTVPPDVSAAALREAVAGGCLNVLEQLLEDGRFRPTPELLALARSRQDLRCEELLLKYLP